jgi:hypothetical protein
MFVEKLDPESPDMVLYFPPEEGRTRQEFAEDADINVLMARFEKTGQLPSNIGANAPAYLDVSEVPDLATALAVVEEAKRAFLALPARARAEFDNDPVAFMAFAQDPANLDQMRTWGLAPPAEVPEPPLRVEVVNEPVDAGTASAGSKKGA